MMLLMFFYIIAHELPFFNTFFVFCLLFGGFFRVGFNNV